MTDFADLAARAPLHDESTCSREGCGRCRPSGVSRAPAIPQNPHQHNRKPPAPPVRWDLFAASLEQTAADITKHAQEAWDRTYDWQDNQAPKWKAEADTDEQAEARRQGTSERDATDRREAAAAAKLHAELRNLTQQTDAALARIRRIIAIATPETPKTLASRDMLAAQVAADGYCVSCWRDEQTLTLITERSDGTRYFRDRCKPCGQYKGANGEDRPIEHLRAIREGRRLRVKA